VENQHDHAATRFLCYAFCRQPQGAIFPNPRGGRLIRMTGQATVNRG
jgi:hypothetical protein